MKPGTALERTLESLLEFDEFLIDQFSHTKFVGIPQTELLVPHGHE